LNAAISSDRIYAVRRPAFALLLGVAVGMLGGLIGLGGAEFRLPLLILIFELYAHRAIRINLLISLVTLCFALATRLRFFDAGALSTHQSEIAAMVVSGVLAAWLGAGALSRIPKHHITAILAGLLVAISGLLMVETAFQGTAVLQLPESPFVRVAVGLVAGLGIGAVSSLLGVAGGELIIPVMIFLFGADIKTAGTASLLIAIPTVTTGVLRHWLHGRFRSRSMLLLLAVPMSLGSAVGAVLGGVLASVAPADGLRMIFALILAASAYKLWRQSALDQKKR
jgi:uncharacterized membrane protein YfcA